jgi:hypothetical protein
MSYGNEHAHRNAYAYAHRNAYAYAHRNAYAYTRAHAYPYAYMYRHMQRRVLSGRILLQKRPMFDRRFLLRARSDHHDHTKSYDHHDHTKSYDHHDHTKSYDHHDGSAHKVRMRDTGGLMRPVPAQLRKVVLAGRWPLDCW